MKKILLGFTATALSLTLAACGTSANDAAVKSLSNQLDETSNTISDFKIVNPSDISMSKETLSTLATSDKSIYDNLINTQQSLLNEEYYKTDILSRTANIKNCLSKDIKLSKAQISAVKDLTNNLSKYTNSISYTKSELNSAVKSVSTMKKNASKNADKINAKLSRIVCNSNARSAYYQNILNTLTQLENYLCCDDCNNDTNEENTQQPSPTENNQTQSATSQSKNIENKTNSQNSTESTESQSTQKGLPINIDTYAPMNRNLDAYNMTRTGYGYNGAYGYGYGNNYGNNFYGYNRGAYPYPPMAYPYGNLYNSNNINRMNYGAMPVAEIDDKNSLAEQRLEDFEELKDGELTKIDNDTSSKLENKNKITTSNSNAQPTSNTSVETNIKSAARKLEDLTSKHIEKTVDNSAKNNDFTNSKAVTTTARELKKIKPIEDNRTPEEIQKDLDQPITAH